jgi:hypothetical protein
MVQPFLTAAETITPFISVDADFMVQTQTAPVQVVNSGALWDTGVWDVDLWFGSIVQTTFWLSTEAMGHALAIHLTSNISTGTSGIPALFDFSFFDQAEFDIGSTALATVLQVNAFNALIEMGGFI